MSKRAWLILNYFITASLLYVVFKRIPVEQIMRYLPDVNVPLIVLAIVISVFFRLVYHPWLWKKVFNASSTDIRYRDMFIVNAISLPMKYILPFKITEVVRPAGLYLLGKMKFSVALGASLLLRCAILLATLSLLLLGSAGTGNMRIAGLCLAGIVAVVVLIAFMKKLPQEIFGFSVRDISHCFSQSTPRAKMRIYGYSLVMQGGEVVVSYCILRAFGAAVPLPILIFSIGLMMLVSSIPFSIQGIGVRETIAAVTLGKLISPELGLVVGISITLIHHMLPALAGALVWACDATSRSFSLRTVFDRCFNG